MAWLILIALFIVFAFIGYVSEYQEKRTNKIDSNKKRLDKLFEHPKELVTQNKNDEDYTPHYSTFNKQELKKAQLLGYNNALHRLKSKDAFIHAKKYRDICRTDKEWNFWNDVIASSEALIIVGRKKNSKFGDHIIIAKERRKNNG